MKTILVDAVNAFVMETENGFEIFESMQKMLDEFPNTKIILTGANNEQFSINGWLTPITLSAMLGGNKNLQIKEYKALSDVEEILKNFFTQIDNTKK